MQQRHPVVRLVGEDHAQFARSHSGGRVFKPRTLSHEHEITNELTPAPRLTRRSDALQLWPSAPQILRRVLEKGGRPMDVPATFGFAADCDVTEDLCLQRRSETFHRF